VAKKAGLRIRWGCWDAAACGATALLDGDGRCCWSQKTKSKEISSIYRGAQRSASTLPFENQSNRPRHPRRPFGANCHHRPNTRGARPLRRDPRGSAPRRLCVVSVVPVLECRHGHPLMFHVMQIIPPSPPLNPNVTKLCKDFRLLMLNIETLTA